MKEENLIGGALDIRHRNGSQETESWHRLILVVLGIYLLTLGVTLASAYSWTVTSQADFSDGIIKGVDLNWTLESLVLPSGEGWTSNSGNASGNASDTFNTNSSWIEYDPNNRIELDATTDKRIEFNSLTRNEIAYFYKDRGAGNIGDFYRKFTFKIESASGANGIVIQGFSDTLSSCTNCVNCVYIQWSYAASGIYLVRRTASSYAEYPTVALSVGTQYWVIFSRVSSTITVSFYSDNTFSTLVGSSTLPIGTNSAYQYEYALTSYNDGSTGTVTGWIDEIRGKYNLSGSYISSINNTGASYSFKNLTINGTFPTATSVLIGINYSTDNSIWTQHTETYNATSNSTWDFTDFNAQYLKFNLTLQSPTNNSVTPQVDNVTVYYDDISGGGAGSSPNWASVSVNVTYAKNGTVVNVTTLGVNDSDGSSYGLITGSTEYTEEWCNSTVQYGLTTNGSNPYCTFIFNFTDDTNHTFYARIKDNTSLNSTNKTFNITADNYRPNLSVLLPIDGGNYSTRNAPLNYTIDDNGSGINKVWYTINGSGNVTTNGSNTTANFSGDGYWVLQVWVNDTLGWANNSTNITILIDTTKPNLTLYSPNNTNLSNSTGVLEANLSYSVSDSGIGLGSVWYEYWNLADDSKSKHNISATGNGTFNVSVEGQYTFKLWANDTLGNTNSTTNVTFWFDLPPVLTNPNASPIIPAIGNTVNLSVVITDNFTSVASARVALTYPSSTVISYSLTSGSGVWYYLFPANIYGTFTATFYANDVSAPIENSSTSVTFTVPSPAGGSIPPGGGGGGTGGVPTLTPTPTPTPEITEVSALLLKPYKVDDTLWIAPWDLTPGRNYPIVAGNEVTSCEATGNVGCEVITPTRLVLRYQPSILAWNQFTQEVRASVDAHGENNTTVSIPIKIRVINFGLYIPWELGITQFSGRNFIFKVEKDIAGVEHVRGILIYWMIIAGVVILISGERIYKSKKEKEARKKVYRRSLGYNEI